MTEGERKGCLGIIAGGGAIPITVAEAAAARGERIHILGFRGAADEGISRFPHSWLRWGQIGRLLRILRQQGCHEIVIVGSVRRPNLSKMRIDFGLLRNLPTILSLLSGGDDSVLSRVVKFFESHGFRVRGAHEIVPRLLAPAGPLGRHRPDAQHHRDIARGLEVVAALGALDVGQAAVVSRGYVLAVEAAEGTDAMLRRCCELRQWGRKGPSGVLVKCPKPGQELRVDLPAIGPTTVTLAAEAGLAGIAVTSGQVMIADQAALVEEADRRGIFVFGLAAERAG